MATNPPTTVANPPNPQVPALVRDIIGPVDRDEFRKNNAAAFREYEGDIAQGRNALANKYFNEAAVAAGGPDNVTQAQFNQIVFAARDNATLAANQKFAVQIANAGAGQLTNSPAPTPLATQPIPPISSNTAPVNPAANPQAPAAAPTPPPGRPLLPLRDDGGSFNRQIGDVREDGAVLTQFLDNGTPVFVINASATNSAVSPTANPQVPAATTPAQTQVAAAPTVNPATNPQVPADAVISDSPLQVLLGGVVITNQTDLDTLARLGNDVFVTRDNLFRTELISPRNPAVIARVNELRERLIREEASYDRFRNAAIARARTAAPPPVAPAANPQVTPADPPSITGDETAFVPTPPGAALPNPVSPATNPQVPPPPPPPPARPATVTTTAKTAAEIALAAEQQNARDNARAQAQLQAQRAQAAAGDWRLKLRLAPGSDYLYNAAEPGILQPLQVTDGVIFPYTPSITTTYTAQYNSYDLTHSNYRGYFYQGSHVGELNITATFTAQDSNEAAYLLAVIQFFRSVTKMFYGQQDAFRGSPPPLVFLQGYGDFQFNLNPCVVQTFNYNLPADVDYIRAGAPNIDGTSLLKRRDRQTTTVGGSNPSNGRMIASGLNSGGMRPTPPPVTLGRAQPTYVPTKMEITLVLLPMQTRSQVSREFSLERFANGSLVQRGFW